MRNVTVRRLGLPLAALVLWGPPALRATGRDRDAALASPLQMDPAAAFQIGSWVAAAILVTVLVVKHTARRTRFLRSLLRSRPLAWHLVFGCFALLSATYSPSSLYSAFFAAKLLIAPVLVALVLWHARRGGPDLVLSVFFVVYALQGLAVFALYVTVPALVTPLEEEVRMTGGMFVDYGSSALFTGIVMVVGVMHARRPTVRLLCSAGYVVTWVWLLLSQTRSTMGVALLALAVLAGASHRTRIWTALSALVGLAAAAVLLPTVLSAFGTALTRGGDGIATLSGRTVVFDYLIDRWQDSPLYGYGYAAGTRSQLVEFPQHSGLGIGSGHDVLSTSLVDVGLIGLTLLLGTLVSAWAALLALRRRTRSGSAERIRAHVLMCLLAYVTLAGIVNPGVAGYSPALIVVLVCIWAWPEDHHVPDRASGAATASPGQQPELPAQAQ